MYECEVCLAELDRSETAFRYVHELLEERTRRSWERRWWRVTFNLFKGRDCILWREDVFMRGETFVEVARHAIRTLEDEHSGLIEIVAMRLANYKETLVLGRNQLARSDPFHIVKAISRRRVVHGMSAAQSDPSTDGPTDPTT